MLTDIDRRLAALVEDRESIVAQMNALMEDTENFDEDAEARYEEFEASLVKLDKSIAREEKLKAAAETAPRPKPANQPKPQEQITVTPAWEEDDNLGYKAFDDFLLDVMHAGRGVELEGDSSQKMTYLAAAGSDEQRSNYDSKGGYLVPEGFLRQLYTRDAERDPTMGLTTMVPMANPMIKIPARTDHDHDSSVSGGLTVAWRAETQTPTSSTMDIETITLDANTLMGLTYVTEELLEDSAISVLSIISQGFADEFTNKKVDGKIRGTGVGQFEGVLNNPATIALTRTTASTLDDADVTAARRRCYNYGRAIWLAHHDCYTALTNIFIGYPAATPVDTQPLFKPGNGSDVPDTLLGRPIFFTEYCSSLGTKGDLILADWSQYLEGQYKPLRNASSMHVRFLNHESTFKFWERCDGRGWWRAAFDPQNSTETLSPFVVVAT